MSYDNLSYTFKMLKDDNSLLSVGCDVVNPLFSVKYTLKQLSNGKVVSVGDRGYSTDRFETDLSIRLEKELAEGFIFEVNALREAQKELVLSDFQFPVFGDNVDHSGNISCVVGKMGLEESPEFNLKTINIRLIPTDLQFINGSLPVLACLEHDYTSTAEWKTGVNETYNRGNYFVDRVGDTYVFSGYYLLEGNETGQLIEFWRQQRGEVLTVDESGFGVVKMFGATIAETSHNVIIKDINYSIHSNTKRSVNIQLIKV